MPRGTTHEETGLLVEQAGGLALRRDDGGTWRLDAPWRSKRLAGKRVRIVGVRDGFDLLAVKTISAL